jgi:indole-3-acetate monooxygenase
MVESATYTAATAAIAADPLSVVRSIAPVIREAGDEAERMRQCPPRIVDLLHENHLFDMILPTKFGGFEESIPTMVRVLEELAVADASIAWVVGIANGTSIIAAHMDESTAASLFLPRAVAGGAQAPWGKAVRAEGGYTVTGRWPFASGCTHCTMLVGGCMVVPPDGASALMPEYKMAVFPIDQVEIIDTWNVSGLRGTGSHDMKVEDVFVPDERMLAFNMEPPRIDAPTYRYPALGFLALTISPIPLGIARRAIDELLALAGGKTPMNIGSKLAERPLTHYEIGRAEAILRSARAWMYEVMDEIWDRAVAGEEITPRDRAMVRSACAHAALESLRAVEIAYTLGGGSSIYEGSMLQRCLRDAHATTQHVMLAPPNYEPAGRALLGLDLPPMV